jgi:DNA-binding transcriptional ArsR family regulator
VARRAVIEITDPATLNVITHPLRMQLLEHLEAPRTVRELGELVGKPADRLYYHLKLLRQHDLVVELPGKRFECAGSIAVSGAAISSVSQVQSLTSDLLARVGREIAIAVANKPEGQELLVGLNYLRLDPSRRTELGERISALLAEFEADEGEEIWGLHVGVYPVLEE